MKAIDQAIKSILTDFNAYLWTGSNKAYYGRVFRNQRENGFLSPEIWKGGNNYLEVLKDTTKDAQLFFDVQPDVKNQADINTADVWLCCMVNLQTLYPTLSRNEATEAAQKAVKDLLLCSEFTVNGMITGFEGFKSYDWDASLSDMSPNYLFRFNLSIVYINN